MVNNTTYMLSGAALQLCFYLHGMERGEFACYMTLMSSREKRSESAC